MPNTYVALATQTLGTATNSVTFSLSGISGYTDLMLEINGAVASGNPAIWYRVNGDSTSLYSFTRVTGNGTSALSSRESTQTKGNIASAFGMTTTFETNIQVHFMNYSNTTTNKTLLARANTPSLGTEASVNLWRNTNAITSIEILTSSGTNFVVGSTFSLYGIANADQGAAKATGGMITEDANYWYHTFAASGVFIPKQALTCDVLVVAGGGGGSYGQTGTKYGVGGGAGQVLLYSNQSLTNGTVYSCTVGAGGTGAGATLDINGGNGVVSTFQGLTSAAAGQGGQYTGTGGASGSGNAGGASSGTLAGGGAGQGAVGGNAGGGLGGAGGIGISTYNSWSQVTGIGENVSGTYYLAGGGAGSIPYGARGLGGGGGVLTSNTFVGSAGFSNTGGGASGGTYGSFNAPNGGSGVVIVRYAK